MSETLLSYHVWLELPMETRQKIAKLFKIRATGESVVRIGAMKAGNIAGEVQSDSFRPSDLHVITVASMQDLLGSESEDFYALFKQTVEYIDVLQAGAKPEKKKAKKSEIPTEDNFAIHDEAMSLEEEIIENETPKTKKAKTK